MKKTIILLLLVGFAAYGYSQGSVALDNLNNTSTNPTATASGLFWLSTGGTPVLISQDFNAAFYGGTDSSSLSPLATFLLNNGTAGHDNGFGPGTFLDPTGGAYTIQGPPYESAFFQIEAWTGNFNTYAAAVAAGAPAAQSPVFINPISVPPGPPPDLLGMPAMVLNRSRAVSVCAGRTWRPLRSAALPTAQVCGHSCPPSTLTVFPRPAILGLWPKARQISARIIRAEGSSTAASNGREQTSLGPTQIGSPSPTIQIIRIITILTGRIPPLLQTTGYRPHSQAAERWPCI